MEFVLSCLGCVLVGIILSAPMGPVGMLCVQQTLNCGRKVGLLTGLGAAFSDWFYCWVAALSMTLIIGFIESHTAAFAIIGGLLLALFSAIMMRSRPSVSSTGSSARGAAAVVAGFLLAFSNPLIIFLIMPLLVYFNVPQPYYHWWHYVLCLLSVLVGAMLWWALVTWVVNRWRRRMTLASLHRVNVVMGVIMLLLSGYSIWRGVRLLMAG